VAIYGQDENMVIFIRISAGIFFLIAIATAIVSWWQPGDLLVPLIALPMGVLFLTPARYAIIFTPSEVIVRPQIGTPQRILYSAITRMTKTTVPSGKYGTAPALIIGLPFGQTYLLRLNVEHAEEMLRRLQEATGKQVN